MDLRKCFAAILLIEWFYSSGPRVSCALLIDMVQDLRLLLTYPGWRGILRNVKTNTAVGQLDDDGVTKLIDQKEDININNVLAVNFHIFLMMNCRYASRLFFLTTIINDLATECGYTNSPDQVIPFSISPLKYCEEVLYTAFQLISIDLLYAYSALEFFETLSRRKIARKGIRPINKTFKRNYEKLFHYSQMALSLATIKTQLYVTVHSLELFNAKLDEYFSQKCRVEDGYSELLTSYRFELDELKQQPNLHDVFQYFQMKIIEVSDDITEKNFRDCGFLYNSETEKCTVRHPEASTS